MQEFPTSLPRRRSSASSVEWNREISGVRVSLRILFIPIFSQTGSKHKFCLSLGDDRAETEKIFPTGRIHVRLMAGYAIEDQRGRKSSDRGQSIESPGPRNSLLDRQQILKACCYGRLFAANRAFHDSCFGGPSGRQLFTTQSACSSSNDRAETGSEVESRSRS